jgi:hypothetical protein
MNAIQDVDLQNQAVGLAFEQTMGKCLKILDPRLKDMRSTKNTDLQYISDFRIDDERGRPTQLIEIKSHRWFSTVDTHQSVLERMTATSIERSKASGKKVGLFHQFDQSQRCLDDDRGNFTLVIVGLYDKPGHIHAAGMLSEDKKEHEKALDHYTHYLLIWNFIKHADGFSCLLESWRFHKLIALWGLETALSELEDIGLRHEPELDGAPLQIEMHVPSGNFYPDAYEEYVRKHYESVYNSSNPVTSNNKPWYADKTFKGFEPSSPDEEPLNEDEELPSLIDDVDLSLNDFKDIRDGILADMSLTDISKIIGKSETYLSGLLGRNHPKYDEFKRWILPIMKRVCHQSLPDPIRYEKIMKTSDNTEARTSDQSNDGELSKVIQRQNNLILNLQEELNGSRKRIKQLENELNQASEQGQTDTKERLKKAERLILDLVLERGSL